jgi:ubiquinone biosynthesis protein
MGTPADRVNLAQLRDEIQGLLEKYVGGKLSDVSAGGLMRELLDVAMRYRIRIQPDYAILAKMGITIEGIIRSLQPDLDIGATIAPYSRKLLFDRFGPKALGELATKQGLALVGTLQDLPLQLTQILTDLETGRTTVKVDHPELAKLSRSMNDLGTKTFLGLVTCGLILGASFLLARYRLEIDGFPIVAVLMALAALGIVTVVFWWHVLYGRVKKIRLGFWMNLFRKRKPIS